ncbi:MAG: Uncharacterised protein [Polaribacter sp. SA4-10]|nr:MAG: Uncharacterised protein [Polaribacter sp. SA4-10]
MLPFLFTIYLGCFTSFGQNQTNDNEKIRSLITKKRDYNKRKGFGYRIQLYNGSEINAKRIRKEFNKKFPKVKTHLKFDTPEWKIQVGNYKTTLEADKALININLKFSGAIVIPINK